MLLPALKFLEHRQVWILVIERNDEPQEHPVVCRVIKKSTALGVIVERPTGRVHDQPCIVFVCIDLPDFLEANAVVLRVRILSQIKTLHQLLPKIAVAAFGKNRVLAQQLISRLVARLLLSIFGNAHVACRNTCHPALVVIENFCCRESRKYVDSHCLGLLAEPLAQPAQADDVVTLVMHGTWHEQRGNTDRLRLAEQKVDVIACDGNRDGRALVLPIGKQLVEPCWLEHIAG